MGLQGESYFEYNDKKTDLTSTVPEGGWLDVPVGGLYSCNCPKSRQSAVENAPDHALEKFCPWL